MIVRGPRRGLFLACLTVGVGSLLALDLHFAPAALSADTASDPAAGATGAEGPRPTGDAAATPPARVVIPAPARVPTIVARFESASKEPVDQATIRVLATAMIEDHDVTIVLEGHSDTRGGDDFNHTISLERANWVKARLVELGVSGERIETVGLGATRPLRSDDPDGPSVNRRVEVRWLGNAPRDTPLPRPVVKAAAPRDSASSRASASPREEPPRDSTPIDASASSDRTDAQAPRDASVRASEPAADESPPHDEASPPRAPLEESPQPGEKN